MKIKIILLVSVMFFISCNKETPTLSSLPEDAAKIIVSADISIYIDSVKIKCIIDFNGDTNHIIEAGICYTTIPGPDITDSKIVSTIPIDSFYCVLKNLESNTIYYLRAYYKNKTGVIYSNEVSFRTPRYPIILGNHFFNGIIETLSSDPSGNIYAGGEFSHYANWNYVAKWDGNNWSEMTDLKAGSDIRTISTNSTGAVFVGYRKFASIVYNVAKYEAGNWSNVGVYNSSNFSIVNSCTDAFGNIYIIGANQNMWGKYYVAKWGPEGYKELGMFDDLLLSICTDKAGNLYAAGLPNHRYGNDQSFYVSKWNGTSWSEIGAFNDVIKSLCIDSSGNLLATGAFRNTSGNYYVAKWDGTSWNQLGDLNIIYEYAKFNHITKICIDKFGNVYAIGDFQNGKYFIKKWDGSSWTNYAYLNKKIYDICTDPAGNVYVGGEFTNKNGEWYVAKFVE